MRYGIAFDGRAPVAETLALAQAAEAHGFERAWVSEHLGHRDPFAYAATLLERTRRIAVGARVREHSHGDQVELQICFRGRGHVMVDGRSHPLVPGTACFLGHDVKHEIVNDGPEELVMLWVITPPGLENFFAAIGRPREAGDPAPAPFARPADVVAIERALGMTV